MHKQLSGAYISILILFFCQFVKWRIADSFLSSMHPFSTIERVLWNQTPRSLVFTSSPLFWLGFWCGWFFSLFLPSFSLYNGVKWKYNCTLLLKDYKNSIFGIITLGGGWFLIFLPPCADLAFFALLCFLCLFGSIGSPLYLVLGLKNSAFEDWKSSLLPYCYWVCVHFVEEFLPLLGSSFIW